MKGTDEMREAAEMARQYRDHVAETLRSGGANHAQRQVLTRLERSLAKGARAWDDVANDLDLLARISEGNTQ